MNIYLSFLTSAFPPLFLVSFLGSLLCGFIVKRFYYRFGWLDDPKKDNHVKVVHLYPVPRGGGLVVGLPLLVCLFLFFPLTKQVIGIGLGALVLIITGVLDDIYDIHPYWRLAAGTLAALCVVASGVGIAYVTNPIGSGVIPLNQPQIPIFLFGKLRTIWVLADIFAVLWIVWCMNMMNWSKGVDGQLPGIVVIAAAVIGIVALRFVSDPHEWSVVNLALVTSGVYAGLLFWNMYPQRMMPGYGGGSIAGYLLAVLSILSGAKLATLLVVLGVPMMDAIIVMIRRMLNGKSPVWGDRSHFHHLLMDIGWGKRRIAAFYWLSTLFFGFVALQLNPRQKPFTIIGISLVFIGVSIWLRWLITYSKLHDRDNG